MQKKVVRWICIGLLLALTPACALMSAPAETADTADLSEKDEGAVSEISAVEDESVEEQGDAPAEEPAEEAEEEFMAEMPAAPQALDAESAGAAIPQPTGTAAPVEGDPPDTMIFEDYGTNPFVVTAVDNLSTFAVDIDTGSYTLARSYLSDYYEMPPPES